MTDHRTLHVTPVGDHIDHPPQDDCVCRPRVERVPRADGSDGWVVVHHSLDGREHTDQVDGGGTATP